MSENTEQFTREGLAFTLVNHIANAEGKVLGTADREYTLELLFQVMEVIDGGRKR